MGINIFPTAPIGIKNVQRGSTSVNSGATVNVTITSVNLSKSFVTCNVIGNLGAGSQIYITAQLIDSTTLRLISVGSVSIPGVVWEVIEYY